jgi:hypothetical protein
VVGERDDVNEDEEDRADQINHGGTPDMMTCKYNRKVVLSPVRHFSRELDGSSKAWISFATGGAGAQAGGGSFGDAGADVAN